MSNSIVDTEIISEAFVKAVLNFRETKALNIGLTGEPGSGKSAFSNIFLTTSSKEATEMHVDEFNQFNHMSDTGTLISRRDLRAEALEENTALTKVETEHSINIIEHPDADQSIACDISLTISFIKDKEPVNVCDMEDELWQCNINDNKEVDVFGECQKISNSTQRYITINFGAETGCGNKFKEYMNKDFLKLSNA